MKLFKTSITVTVALVFTLFITSCINDKKTTNEEMNHQTEMKSDNHGEMNHDNNDGHHDDNMTSNTEKRELEASTQKKPATASILEAYFQIKNGLVTDDKNAAAKGGTALLAAFSTFDMSKLSGETHKEYMEIYENAKEQAEHIVKSSIDHQREHFETLSTDISDLITLLGTDKKVYQAFCPMASDGKGAVWLSEFKEIKNPFFGSKMLTCGSVQKEI